MTEFAWDYLKLAFVAGVGVIQIAAAYSGLRGLQYFYHPRTAGLMGVALTALAFAWFFASGTRNLPDTTLGLDGNEQVRYFAFGGGASVIFSLFFSSVRNASFGKGDEREYPGLEALRHTTFLRAFGGTLRKKWKLYSDRSGAPTSR